MVKITGEYQGDLHCLAVHEPSANILNTDAPKDNQGRGEAFSPTDLTATSFATCIATTMAMAARKHARSTISQYPVIQYSAFTANQSPTKPSAYLSSRPPACRSLPGR